MSPMLIYCCFFVPHRVPPATRRKEKRQPRFNRTSTSRSEAGKRASQSHPRLCVRYLLSLGQVLHSLFFPPSFISLLIVLSHSSSLFLSSSLPLTHRLLHPLSTLSLIHLLTFFCFLLFSSHSHSNPSLHSRTTTHTENSRVFAHRHKDAASKPYRN